MATITVKDIPDDLYEKLKKAAAAHHRSINREIIHYIEHALQNRKVDIEEVVAEARRIQAKVGSLPLNKDP